MKVILFPFQNMHCSICVHFRSDMLGKYCNLDKKASIRKIAECDKFFSKQTFDAIYKDKKDYGDL